ncbi:MAG: hypothetical protein FWD69_19595 [Polyangiaceae bacterium]|nr:hypothetical protein [Polyangiaceae bacterium]
MQNGTQTSTRGAGRLLGFVRVLIGGRVHDLAVQAITVDQDGLKSAGGFFADEGQMGILVDDAAPPPEIQAQIERGTAEAVRHLSRRYLN